MHEDRLSCTARRKISHRRLGLHVFHGVHSDAEMRKKSFGENFAQLVVNGRSARRHTVASAISTKSAEERAVRRTGVTAVETVDDVETILERIECLNRLGQRRISEGTIIANTGCRKAGLGIESLVLHEENHPLEAAGSCRHIRRCSCLGQVGEKSGAAHGSSDTGGHSFDQISTIHDLV